MVLRDAISTSSMAPQDERNVLEQFHLPVPFRRPEQVAADRREAFVHAMFARGALDAGAAELGPDAVAAHPGEENGVVVAAAANVLDHVQHLVGAVDRKSTRLNSSP